MTMALLRYAAKFDPIISLETPTLHPGTIQGKEGIKFCHLATLRSSPARLMTDGERTDGDSIKSVGCGGEKESELI